MIIYRASVQVAEALFYLDKRTKIRYNKHIINLKKHFKYCKIKS